MTMNPSEGRGARWKAALAVGIAALVLSGLAGVKANAAGALATHRSPGPSADFGVPAEPVSGSLEGVIVSSDGVEQSGACVTASRVDAPVSSAEPAVYRSVVTSTGGRYLFSGLEPGLYHLTAEPCPGSGKPETERSRGFYLGGQAARAGQVQFRATVVAGVIRKLGDRELPVGLVPAGLSAMARFDSESPAARTLIAHGQFGSISGTVETTAGRPASGACYLAEADSHRLFDEVGGPVTDGKYDATYLPAGDWTVAFFGCSSRANLAPQWWDRGGRPSEASVIELKRGSSVSGIDGVLRQGGKISGRVVDAKGQGVVGACVEAEGAGLGSQAVSGKEGRFVVSSLGSRSYRFYAAPCKSSLNLAPTAPRTKVHAQAGKQVTGYEITLPAGGTVSGTVTDTSDVPLAGMCVQLVSTSPLFEHDTTQWTSTGTGGTFSIDQLPAAHYGVLYEAGCGNSGNYVSTSYPGIPSDEAAPYGVHLTPGGNATADVAIEPGGTISGRVTAPNGTGVQACIAIGPAHGFTEPETEPFGGAFGAFGGFSSADGRYSIGALPPGNYAVLADPCGSPEIYAATYLGGRAGPPGETASVPEGVAVPDVNLQVALASTLSGTIRTEPVLGRVRELTCVTLRDQRSGRSVATFQFRPSASGAYSVTGLPIGQFVIEAEPCGTGATYFAGGVASRRVAPAWSGDASSLTSARLVTLRPGRKSAGVDFAFRRSAEVTGVVTGPTGQPLQKACVAVYSVDQYAEASTTVGGRYSLFGLGNSTVTMDVSDCRPDPRLSGATAVVSVSDGRLTHAPAVRLATGGVLTGRIEDPTHLPVLSACVYTDGSAAGVLQAGVVTDATGRYVLYGVPVGRVGVWVEPSCFLPSPLATERIGVEIVSPKGRTSLDTTVDPDFGAIDGTVTDSSAGPLAGVCVVAVPTGRSSHTSTSEIAVTAASGGYQIVGPRAGTYHVEFSSGCGATGYAEQWWQDAPSPATATLVTVANGAASTGIDAALASG